MTAAYLLRDRRASVALWIGLTFPTLMMALGLGIEVASWSVTRVELQRIADAAALAGAMNYTQTTNATSATTAAANVAGLNGILGGNLSASVVSGVKSASDTAIKVTAQQNVPLVFANIFSSLGSVTVTATAWSELVQSSPASPQPCMAALTTSGSGGTGIATSGATVITDTTCSLRSNNGVSVRGTGSLRTGGIYAASTISIQFPVTETGAEYPLDGTISDPYLSYVALQTALAELSPGSGSALVGTSAGVNPGTYSSFTISGASVAMAPGLYIINGPVTISGTTSLTGTGVTIIASGSISVTGTFSGNLTAPGTSPMGGAVPGILMASTGGSVSFRPTGGFSFPFTGVMYFPDASVTMSGSTSLGSSGCAELVGGSLTFSGSATFSGGCASYGAPSYGSLPSTSSVALVQ
jgi:hypothetical protein